MFVNAALATVGSLGILFYLRFLLALCADSKRDLIGYWIRLRNEKLECSARGVEREQERMRRVA
jgi:hypothetical protein